jgi:glyoxylate carboligase
MVDAIAAPVEPVFGTVTASIEAIFGAVAAPIDPFATFRSAVGALRGVLRRHVSAAHEQPQTEPYCTAFHLRPP